MYVDDKTRKKLVYNSQLISGIKLGQKERKQYECSERNKLQAAPLNHISLKMIILGKGSHPPVLLRLKVVTEMVKSEGDRSPDGNPTD